MNPEEHTIHVLLGCEACLEEETPGRHGACEDCGAAYNSVLRDMWPSCSFCDGEILW